jgi:cGMP-dependent protein kinase 2
MQFDQTLAALGNCPIFAYVDPAARRVLAQTAAEAHYDTDEEIVAEGEPADRMFIFSEGRADVFLRGKDGPIPVASLGPGDTFGEIALLTSDGVRTANVRAASPLIALTVSRGEFQALLARLPAFAGKLEQLRDEMLAQNFLKLSTAFGSLNAGNLSAFVQRLSRRTAAPGETIIRQGERGEHADLIRTGRVDVVLEGNGPEQQLTTLGPGSLLGELALLSDAPRNATVRVKESCDLLVLRREDLLWAIDQNSEIGETLYWMLNSRDRPQRVEGIEAHRREAANGATVTVLKDPVRSD